MQPGMASPPRWCPRCQVAHAAGCEAALRARRRQSDAVRGTAAQRGYGAKWQKLSKAYLLAHAVCVVCAADGVVRVATVVDHTTPHRGNQALFWDRKNWQPLCKHCHDAKTARGQ
jgi:5-methylcytosine-specific restriction enzyme A